VELDREREKGKLDELRSAIRGALLCNGYSDQDADKLSPLVLEYYVTTTPPEKRGLYTEFVTANSFSGRGGGRSVKAGNIRLNISKLFEAVSAGVFTTISVAAAPWAIPFAALLLWKSLWNVAEVPLSESEIVVLWTLHKMKNLMKVVTEDEEAILQEVNAHLSKYDREHISRGDLRHALSNLLRIDSIERTRDNALFIREWIRVSYT
jgi:hypothetical protein